MKICSKCKEKKPITEYYDCKDRADGKRDFCKSCWSETARIYRETHKAELTEKNQRYREKNKTRISNLRKAQYKKHRDKILKYHAKTRKHNNEVKKIYREKNRGAIAEKFKKWSEENKVIHLAIRREKRKMRMECDPQFRLNKSFSQRMRESLISGKNGASWEGIVGYTLKDLKLHLGKYFLPGMTWENYGLWHVDHKIPISAFNYKTPDDMDFKRCWALSNLQPLWAKDNIIKNDSLDRPFQPSLAMAY